VPFQLENICAPSGALLEVVLDIARQARWASFTNENSKKRSRFGQGLSQTLEYKS
jgi:hypothetical protein